MMSLFLGKLANAVHKCESSAEIWKCKRALQVMTVDHLPPRNFLL